MRALWLAGLIGAAPSLAAPHCDIPGAALRSEKAASAEACATLCGKTAPCVAWVYVSGWGQCSLKAKAGKARPLKIWAASKGEAPQVDRDHSGKDFKKIAHVADAVACKAHCEKTEGCLAMAYLDGYQDCYLKNTAGNLTPKIFYCGERPQTP